MKAHTYANGENICNASWKEEEAYPMVILELFIIKIEIDGKMVSMVDIQGSLLTADMDKALHMVMWGQL